MPTLTLNGVLYEVVSQRDYTLGNEEGFSKEVTRTRITLKRPRGKKFYHVFRYENGSYSSVISP